MDDLSAGDAYADGDPNAQNDDAWVSDDSWDPVDQEEIRQAAASLLTNAETANDDQDLLRKDNLDRFLGLPYGTERKDYCQAVDRTCMETVGWILPALLEIFHGSDHTGAFEPGSEDDVEASEQATDLVNHVYMRDNPGFLISAAVIQDALVEGLGVWKVSWDDAASVSVSTHLGLDEMQAASVLADEEVELLAMRTRVERGVATPDMMAQLLQAHTQAVAAGMAPPPVEPPAQTVFDIKVRRTTRRGRVKVEALPNSEFGYEPGARSREACNFFYHRRRVPRADLTALGYAEDVIEGLASSPGGPTDPWRPAQEANAAHMTWTAAHESMELVAYYECYLRADFDRDGVAEWRKVCLAGEGKELLHQEIVERPLFIPVSPILLSHRLEGLAVVDLVRDLQGIRTDLLRLMVDGFFDTVIPRAKVRATAARETWEAVLNPATGKPIPVNNPDDVTWDNPTWSGAQALPLLEWLDQQRERRTGVSATSTGTDPDMLQNQTAAAVNQLMTAAQQKIGLIARIFAETGLAPLFMGILQVLVRHQDRPRTIRLRNKFVTMDAAHWNASMDYVPNVGLGTGDKGKVRAALLELLAVQEKALAGGLGIAGPKQVYNLLKELVRASQLPSVDPYFIDPESPEAQALQPAPSDPLQDPAVAGLVAGEQVKAQTALERERIEDAFRRDKMWVDLAMESMKLGVPVPWTDLLSLISRPPPMIDDAGAQADAPPPQQVPAMPPGMPPPSAPNMGAMA